MSHPYLKLSLSVLLAANLACAVGASSTADSTAVAQQAANTQAAEAQMTQTQEAQVTAVAATATAAFGQTATPARATAVAADKQSTRAAATAQAAAQATTVAQSIAEEAAHLSADGYLTHAAGTFFAVPDFSQSWAQLGWYKWWLTDYTPTDFVIRANATWRSASNTADWWTSGCGFVFRIQDEQNHYLAFLGLDGRVYFSGFRKGNYFALGSARYGKLDTPDGKAQIMLVVQGSKFDFFVNDTHVYSRTDKAFASGDLALTLLSGTNKDFGTNCTMRNIELWELE